MGAVAEALRTESYAVVDVPLSMLIARVAVQHPRVIVVDADSDGALDVVGRMRELPDADDIHVLFVARPGGVIASPEEALAHEGSGLFVRPVDVSALLRKVGALVGGGEAWETSTRSSPPAPSIELPPKRSSSPPSLPPASMRAASLVPIAPEPRPSSAPGRRAANLVPPVSTELQQLLAEAEQRIQISADHDSIVPSPEDEIEAVLPAELLATLDEPLEEDDDEDDIPPGARSSAISPQATRERTGDAGLSRMTSESSTGAGATPGSGAPLRSPTGDEPRTPAPGLAHDSTQAGPTGAAPSTNDGSEPGTPSGTIHTSFVQPAIRTSSVPPPTAWSTVRSSFLQGGERQALSSLPVSAAAFPAAVAPGEAMRVVGQAIASRTTGTLCVAAAGVERRVVLREGDVVTCMSPADEESLLAFLGARGDLPRETVRRLASKFPPFGRYAGAALVARGYLRQDQMWPTLRAHAEWVLAHLLQLLQTSSARLALEAEPPGRLADEPSVFGGSTGAGVFVEIIRRIVPPQEAIDQLGGIASHVGSGPSAHLLDECALEQAVMDRVTAAVGHTLHEVLDGASDSDLAPVLFALVQLGVIQTLRAVSDGVGPGAESAPDVAALDVDAVRERVRARLQLVEDGDYFAVLGVARQATGYEIRRAFLELRRAFDSSRLLSSEVVDLADDVRKITGVLEEAYEILKDAARRERYRRAIETVPEP
jgi:hypothetical protein